MHLYTTLAPFLCVLVGQTVHAAPQTAPAKGSPAKGSPATKLPTLAAVGITVKSLPRAQAFYTSTLGMRPTGQSYNTSTFDEVILASPGDRPASALALMQYKTQPTTATGAPAKSNALLEEQQQKALSGFKLVFFVEDVKVTVEKIRSQKLEIVTEPGSAKVGNTVIPTAFVRDPDGTLIELNPLSVLPSRPASS